MRRTATFIALAALLPLTGAIAGDDKSATSRIFDELAACRGLADDSARLACFDRTAKTLVTARSKGELLVIDREKVIERKRARFGLSLSDGAVFGGGIEDQATEVKEIESTVREVADASYGRYNIALANGMVWQTTEPMRRPAKVGAPAKLKVALLGAFKLSVAGGESVKVKRIR